MDIDKQPKEKQPDHIEQHVIAASKSVIIGKAGGDVNITYQVTSEADRRMPLGQRPGLYQYTLSRLENLILKPQGSKKMKLTGIVREL